MQIVVDETKCIEQGREITCPCAVATKGGASSGAAPSFDEPADRTPTQEIDMDELAENIGGSVWIKMKNGFVHEYAVLMTVETTQIKIQKEKYGGTFTITLAKDQIEQVMY